MTRTIHVVFPKEIYGTSWEYIIGHKKYAFLCNYDNIKKKDIIVDPRYSSPMIVVDITSNTNRVQNGITLKDIYITMVNEEPILQPSGLVNGVRIGSDFDIDKERANNMEKRNIKVTLEQATEWYNSGNETLRTLALTVFTEEELTLNLNSIRDKVAITNFWTWVPSSEENKHRALRDLTVIAKYFNGSWKKTPSNTGYFLGQSNLKFSNNSRADMIKGLESLRNIGIVEHNTVMYPGIVYFKEKEDLIKAVKIMGDKVKDLFS